MCIHKIDEFSPGNGNFFYGFFSITQCFNDKEELLRNMMGLVGNVAEVKHLRNRLMKSEFISVFSNLLDSDSDGIEVAFINSLLQIEISLIFWNFLKKFRSAIMQLVS